MLFDVAGRLNKGIFYDALFSMEFDKGERNHCCGQCLAVGESFGIVSGCHDCEQGIKKYIYETQLTVVSLIFLYIKEEVR